MAKKLKKPYKQPAEGGKVPSFLGSMGDKQSRPYPPLTPDERIRIEQLQNAGTPIQNLPSTHDVGDSRPTPYDDARNLEMRMTPPYMPVGYPNDPAFREAFTVEGHPPQHYQDGTAQTWRKPIQQFTPGITTGPSHYQLEEGRKQQYLKEKQKLEDDMHDRYPYGKIDEAPDPLTSPVSRAGYDSAAPSYGQQSRETRQWWEAKQKADQLRLKLKYEGGGSGAGGSGSGSGGSDMDPYRGDNYDIEALAQKAAPLHEMGHQLEQIQQMRQAVSDHDQDDAPVPNQESLVEGMPTTAGLSMLPAGAGVLPGAQAAHEALLEMQRLNPQQHKTEAQKLNDWLHNYATSLRNPDMAFDPATGELSPGANFQVPVPQDVSQPSPREQVMESLQGGANTPVSRQELAQQMGGQDPTVQARPRVVHSSGGGYGHVPTRPGSATPPAPHGPFPHLDSLTAKEEVSRPYTPGFDASNMTYGPAVPHTAPAPKAPTEYLSPDGRAIPTTASANEVANQAVASGLPQAFLEGAALTALPEVAGMVGRGGKAVVGKVAEAAGPAVKKKAVEGVVAKELGNAPQGIVAREGAVPRVHASAPGAQNVPPAPKPPPKPSYKVNMSKGEAPVEPKFNAYSEAAGKAPVKPAPKVESPAPKAPASKKAPIKLEARNTATPPAKKAPIKLEARKSPEPVKKTEPKKAAATGNRLRDRKTKGE